MLPGEVCHRVDNVLAAMDLTAQRDLHPFVLSKGDRSRVVIAAVLAREPEILIFDEPTTGQDHQGALRILELTRRLHAAGKTVVVVTHHLYLLPGFAERVLVLGRDVFCWTHRSLRLITAPRFWPLLISGPHKSSS